MVETHNVEFADDDIDGQKIVFFDGKYHEIEDVHIGNYDSVSYTHLTLPTILLV